MDCKQAIRATRNGSQVHRLVIGELPDVMRRQMITARRYRRDLEKLVVSIKGGVSVVDAHYVDEATGAESHQALCRWLMRERYATMSVADLMTCSKEILKAKGVRNAAIAKLGLDQHQQNVIAALYSVTDPDDDPTPTETPPTEPVAAGANVDADPDHMPGG